MLEGSQAHCLSLQGGTQGFPHPCSPTGNSTSDLGRMLGAVPQVSLGRQRRPALVGSWAEGPVPDICIVGTVVTRQDMTQPGLVGPRNITWEALGPCPCRRRGLWSLGQGSGSRASEGGSEEPRVLETSSLGSTSFHSILSPCVHSTPHTCYLTSSPLGNLEFDLLSHLAKEEPICHSEKVMTR